VDEDGLGHLADGDAGKCPAVSGVDDDALARQPRAGAVQPFLLAQQPGPTTGDLAAEVMEVPQGARAAEAVRRHAVVALEAAQGLLGLATEDPVRAPGVVAELE